MRAIERSEKEPSLTDLVQRWLERTPGLEHDGFDFWGKYQKAVHVLIQEQITLTQVCVRKNQNSFITVIFLDAEGGERECKELPLARFRKTQRGVRVDF